MCGEAPESGDKQLGVAPSHPGGVMPASHGFNIEINALEQLKRRSAGRVAILRVAGGYLRWPI
jgi:hypothetical protein